MFIDALSTFTATELLKYTDFVSLTMIAGAFTLKRPDLKKKVWYITWVGEVIISELMYLQIINAPEVIQVIGELPILAELTKSLYDCKYDKFFIALGKSFS